MFTCSCFALHDSELCSLLFTINALCSFMCESSDYSVVSNKFLKRHSQCHAILTLFCGLCKFSVLLCHHKELRSNAHPLCHCDVCDDWLSQLLNYDCLWTKKETWINVTFILFVFVASVHKQVFLAYVAWSRWSPLLYCLVPKVSICNGWFFVLLCLSCSCG